MASVFLGIEKKLNRLVAIKIFVENIFGDKRNARRFLKEGRSLSRLNHPHIVSVYEVGQVDGYYYIVMEYLQHSLIDLIKKRGRIQPHQAIHIVLSVADSLFYLHKRGLIHRDVKPENIMFRKDANPVLLDFGIAKTIGSRTRLTKTGASIGTPYYMSPEQCAARHIDGRSDIYSLGVVLFEMLTGQLPYKAKDTRVIVLKHLRDPIPGLPFSLNKYQILIDRMMAKDKGSRLKSQRELIDICKSLLPGGIPIRDSKPTLSKKSGLKKSSSTQKSITPQRRSTRSAAKKSRVIKKTSRIRISQKGSRKKKSSLKRIFFWLMLILPASLVLVSIFSGYSFKELWEVLLGIFKTILRWIGGIEQS